MYVEFGRKVQQLTLLEARVGSEFGRKFQEKVEGYQTRLEYSMDVKCLERQKRQDFENKLRKPKYEGRTVYAHKGQPA